MLLLQPPKDSGTGNYVLGHAKVVPSGSNLWACPAVYAQAGYPAEGAEGTALARGDEEFTEFAQASYGGLRHAAYLLTGDRHAAEDATQAALVRTYAAWPRVRRDDACASIRPATCRNGRQARTSLTAWRSGSG